MFVGLEDTPCTLTILRPGSLPRSITLTRRIFDTSATPLHSTAPAVTQHTIAPPMAPTSSDSLANPSLTGGSLPARPPQFSTHMLTERPLTPPSPITGPPGTFSPKRAPVNGPTASLPHFVEMGTDVVQSPVKQQHHDDEGILGLHATSGPTKHAPRAMHANGQTVSGPPRSSHDAFPDRDMHASGMSLYSSNAAQYNTREGVVRDLYSSAPGMHKYESSGPDMHRYSSAGAAVQHIDPKGHDPARAAGSDLSRVKEVEKQADILIDQVIATELFCVHAPL
jgi:hypothetical protein